MVFFDLYYLEYFSVKCSFIDQCLLKEGKSCICVPNEPFCLEQLLVTGKQPVECIIRSQRVAPDVSSHGKCCYYSYSVNHSYFVLFSILESIIFVLCKGLLCRAAESISAQKLTTKLPKTFRETVS